MKIFARAESTRHLKLWKICFFLRGRDQFFPYQARNILRARNSFGHTLSMLTRAHKICELQATLRTLCDLLKDTHFFKNSIFGETELTELKKDRAHSIETACGKNFFKNELFSALALSTPSFRFQENNQIVQPLFLGTLSLHKLTGIQYSCDKWVQSEFQRDLNLFGN